MFVTARVHPGETPGSYMLDGFLEALLSDTELGKLLRKHFVFKVIPILNPDGVHRGHYRLDSRGFNLNRCYVYPSADEFPIIYATKAYIDYMHSEHLLGFYLDLHAQPSRPSSFLFGNSQAAEDQAESQLFAKVVSLLTPLFTYNYCDFSERSMHARDPKDHQSKEGCGRVAVHKSTGLRHCYTIECCYEAGRNLASKSIPPLRKSLPTPPFSDIPAYLTIGHTLASALLVYFERVPLCEGDLQELRTSVREQVVAEKTKPALTRKGSDRHKSKEDLNKTEKSGVMARPKQTPRVVHHLKVVSPTLNQPEKVSKLPPIAPPRRTGPPQSRRIISVEGRVHKRNS